MLIWQYKFVLCIAEILLAPHKKRRKHKCKVENLDIYRVGLFCYFVSQDESKNIQFTVLTDRSQGGGSIQDGNLELMVNK